MKSAGIGATLDNLSSLLDINQLSLMTVGNIDGAGDNLVSLLAKINSQDVVARAEKITINGKEGFSFIAGMSKRQVASMNSPDALVNIVGEITAKNKKPTALMEQVNTTQGGGARLVLLESQKALVDGMAIEKLVSDCQALMALLALANSKQELTHLQADQTNAAGVVDDTYGFVAGGSGLEKSQLFFAKSEAEYDTFERFSDRIDN